MIKNNKFIIALTLNSTILTSIFANAENDYYIQFNGGAALAENSKAHSASGGMNHYTKNLGNSGIYGIEGGSSINTNFGTSISFDYLPNFSTSGDLLNKAGNKVGNVSIKERSYVAMFNLYLNSDAFERFVPYLTAGIGYAKNSTKYNGVQNNISFSTKRATTNNFAYKVGAGAKFVINKSFDLDLRYQYMDLGHYKTASYQNYSPYKGKLRANEVILGLAWKF